MREDLALRNLEEIKEVFNKFDVDYWLDLGTLLGAVRDGKIIPWDDDIDIGVREESWESIISIVPELRKRGFYVEVEDWKLAKSFVYRYVLLFRSEWFVGIYPYSLLKDEKAVRPDLRESFLTRTLIMLYHLLFLNKAHVTSKNESLLRVANNLAASIPISLRQPLSKVVFFFLQSIKKAALEYFLVVLPKCHFEKLDTIDFYGTKFSIPFNAEKYLECRYGKDWRIPKQEWSWWAEGAMPSLKSAQFDLKKEETISEAVSSQ
jgi:lipopolysaccharide cholinephosphotransferase